MQYIDYIVYGIMQYIVYCTFQYYVVYGTTMQCIVYGTLQYIINRSKSPTTSGKACGRGGCRHSGGIVPSLIHALP